MKTLIALVIPLHIAACSTRPTEYQVGSDTVVQSRVDASRRHAAMINEGLSVPGLDSPPKVITSEMPDFPRSWQAAGLIGEVVVRFTINAAGTVVDPDVVGAPQPELAALAVATILRWKFEPAKKDGAPVAVRAQQRFDFQVR